MITAIIGLTGTIGIRRRRCRVDGSGNATTMR